MNNWYVWVAAMILPTLIVGSIKKDAFAGFSVPPQWGKRTALIITVGLSVVLGYITRPAKREVRDAVYATGNALDVLDNRTDRVQEQVNMAAAMLNGQ